MTSQDLMPPEIEALGALKAEAAAQGQAVAEIGPWRLVLLLLPLKDGFATRPVFVLSVRMMAARSTEEDWQRLGQFAARLGAPPQPVIPIKNLPPTHAITFRWMR